MRKFVRHLQIKFMKQNSLYIVIEGTVGTGKTTQSKKIYEWLKNKYPERKVIWTREPGGTEIAEDIRSTVQGKKFTEEMEPICEAYLYASSRAQSLRKVVKPILDIGGIVIADRSFLTSVANQGGGRGINVDQILEINRSAIEGFIPNIVLYFDLDIEVGLKRVFDQSGDKFESLGTDFYTKVKKTYGQIQKKKGFFDTWLNIDASGTEEEVFERLKETLTPYLK